MNADLVMVGAGLFGLTIAQQVAERAGARVEIIDVRSHIGGKQPQNLPPLGVRET